MDDMQIEITDSPSDQDEALVIAQTRAYNAAFTERDVRRLCVFVRSADGSIIGGLSGKTYWQYLEISFLWVGEQHRNCGKGAKLVAAAESEARRRGCAHALVDTFSFQAPGFYQKLGYNEFGRLTGFSGEHDRHYLHKTLTGA
jgi:ribosomal protein S18 acetylase RimI-like enzyme